MMVLDLSPVALSAVSSLCSLQTSIDEQDPVRGPIAQEALELAVRKLVDVGMLDIMVSIAARQQVAEYDYP